MLMKKVGKSRIVNALIFILAIFSAFFIMCACSKGGEGGSSGGESGNNSTEIEEITWITVSGVTVEYDGEEHGIIVSGVRDGDNVLYSIGSGEFSAVEPKCVEPGRYEITVVAERDGYKQFKKVVELNITRTELVGIKASDARYIYDGSAHGLQIDGLKDGDEVIYEIGGVPAETSAVSALGKYEIEFRVERRGEGYFIGKANIEIVPDISGIYVSDKEKITVGVDTAIINGKEYPMCYDSSGKGEIAGVGAFTAAGAHFILQEKTFRRPIGAEQIFEFEIDDDNVYAISSVGLVRIEFGAAGAELKLDGETIFTKAGYNYCEEIEREDGTEPQLRRGIATTEVEFDAESLDDITSYEIELSTLPEQNFTGGTETVAYDGKPHGISVKLDGTVYFKTDSGYTIEMPEYIDAGEYVYTVTVVRDGFLPKTVKYTLIIEEAKINDGVYVGNNGIIEITADKALLNGAEIDKNAIKPSGDGVEYGGTVYNKTDKTYITVHLSSVTYIFECAFPEGAQISLIYDDSEIEVLDTDFRTVGTIKYDGSIKNVSVDDRELDPISEGYYILGADQISGRQVVYIVIT